MQPVMPTKVTEDQRGKRAASFKNAPNWTAHLEVPTINTKRVERVSLKPSSMEIWGQRTDRRAEKLLHEEVVITVTWRRNHSWLPGLQLHHLPANVNTNATSHARSHDKKERSLSSNAKDIPVAKSLRPREMLCQPRAIKFT
jgi:hypothetical protein